MNPSVPNTLGRALRGFFADHLPRVRGASPQTVQSYRDTFVLLLRFVASQQRKSVIDLDVGDLGPQVVLDFLQHLEAERHNVPANPKCSPCGDSCLLSLLCCGAPGPT